MQEKFKGSELHVAFMQKLSQVVNLLKNEKYDVSISVIEEFYSVHSENCNSDKLRYECDKWISTILERSGDSESALKILNKIHSDLCPKTEMFISYKTDIIRNLFRVSNLSDAILECQCTLDNYINGDASDLLNLLFYYAKSLQERCETLPEKYWRVFICIVNSFCPSLIDVSSITANNICEMIIIVYEKYTDANKRYSKLILNLDRIENRKNRVAYIKKYIVIEPFDYYRNLAMEELSDM